MALKPPVINPQSPCFCRITIFYSSDLALIRGFFRLAKRLANSQYSTQQLGGLGGDVGVAHEGGADEDGLGATRLQPHDVGPGVDAALGDE